MSDNALLLLALLLNGSGLAWLALAMEVHWKQVRGSRAPTVHAVRTLRALGALALTASLVLSLCADPVLMAVLVWIMAVAVSAAMVAMLLAWRPRWLLPLALGLR